jgi:hypothetical protein
LLLVTISLDIRNRKVQLSLLLLGSGDLDVALFRCERCGLLSPDVFLRCLFSFSGIVVFLLAAVLAGVSVAVLSSPSLSTGAGVFLG